MNGSGFSSPELVEGAGTRRFDDHRAAALIADNRHKTPIVAPSPLAIISVPVALTPGSRLGPYQVTALIGEGGMGKIWRAHHTAPKRDDALKVLPDAFASDTERLAAQVHASGAKVGGWRRGLVPSSWDYEKEVLDAAALRTSYREIEQYFSEPCRLVDHDIVTAWNRLPVEANDA